MSTELPTDQSDQSSFFPNLSFLFLDDSSFCEIDKKKKKIASATGKHKHTVVTQCLEYQC